MVQVVHVNVVLVEHTLVGSSYVPAAQAVQGWHVGVVLMPHALLAAVWLAGQVVGG